MMKRLASVFLIASLFYNVIGYYLLFHQKEEHQWVSSMQEKATTEYQVLEVNASIYSFVQDTDFEYVNQNIEINNTYYHVFKKRIKNNILYLYYLPNKHQDKISSELTNLVNQQLFDDSPSKESPAKKLLKTVVTDYLVTKPLSISTPSTHQIAKVSLTTFTLPSKPLIFFFSKNTNHETRLWLFQRTFFSSGFRLDFPFSTIQISSYC